MSYSAEWLAVSGIGKDEILSRLSLSDTGIVEEEFMEGICQRRSKNTPLAGVKVHHFV